MKKTTRIVIGLFLLIALCTGSFAVYGRGRPAPVPVKRTLYDGVTYRRIVHVFPQPMIAHIIIIDRKESNVKFFVTPADQKDEMPLNARTTSEFLDQFGLQIAVNGDGFTPWWSRTPVDYYPHTGEPVAPLGLSASDGDIYTEGAEDDSVGIEPTIYFSRNHYPSFNRRPNNVFTAISGDRMIVEKGEPSVGFNDGEREPRTAIGINRNGRYLYIIVVDGRQPFYSSGATFLELAKLLVDQGAFFAMALDGGGSSTMVVEGGNGEPVILNSPIDNYIPGRERPVANHFGVYVIP
jgi:hypothetical protein